MYFYIKNKIVKIFAPSVVSFDFFKINLIYITYLSKSASKNKEHSVHSKKP